MGRLNAPRPVASMADALAAWNCTVMGDPCAPVRPHRFAIHFDQPVFALGILGAVNQASVGLANGAGVSLGDGHAALLAGEKVREGTFLEENCGNAKELNGGERGIRTPESAHA